LVLRKAGQLGKSACAEAVLHRRNAVGANSDFSQLLITGGLAHSWEKNTFFGVFEFDYTAAL
jgi:hypothetical protein